MTTVILFVLGAVVGSFLNVAGLRYRSGLGVGGRSFCFTCRTALKWYELVPVFSFIFLRGRCRSCKAKISRQYILVEALTGLVFATVFSFQLSLLQNALLLAAFCLYIVIGIYDAKHTIVPDALVAASALCALGFAWLGGAIVSGLWGAALLFAFFGLIWLLSRGRAMGLGDAKLAASVGLLLGLPAGASAIALSFWLGTILTLGTMFFGRKKLTMKSEIPFAPFIIAGAWLALTLHADLFHLTHFLN